MLYDLGFPVYRHTIVLPTLSQETKLSVSFKHFKLISQLPQPSSLPLTQHEACHYFFHTCYLSARVGNEKRIKLYRFFAQRLDPL